MTIGTLRRSSLVELELGACRQDLDRGEAGEAATPATETGRPLVEEPNIHQTFVVDDAPLAGIEQAIVTFDGRWLAPIGSNGALASDASAAKNELAVSARCSSWAHDGCRL